MKPRSGTAISPTTPSQVKQALDAAVADAGDTTALRADQTKAADKAFKYTDPDPEKVGASPIRSSEGDGEWKTIEGPQTLYRVTSTNEGMAGGDGSPMREGNVRGGHWFTEDQFSSLIDPESGEFSHERFRSYAAVREDWQAGDDSMLRISTMELEEGEQLEARQDFVGHQGMTTRDRKTGEFVIKPEKADRIREDKITSQKPRTVVSMGHARQTLLRQPPQKQIKTVSVNSEEARALTKFVAKRQGERTGKIFAAKSGNTDA